MRSIYLLILPLLFVSCDSGSEPERIVLDQHEFEIGAQGGQLQVKITENCFWYAIVRRRAGSDTLIMKDRPNPYTQKTTP